MSIFRKEGGAMDEIRCDERNYLIWKWRPNGGSERTRKENAVRWGSVLTVREGSIAVFVYKGSHEYIQGPFSEKLRTGNLPVLAPLISLAYGGGSPFPAEVYFINLAEIVQIRFGVPFFEVFDPQHPEFSVPVAVRGAVSFHISDYARFIELHRLDEFDLDSFREQIRSAVSKYVKSVTANAPGKYGIPVIQLERKIAELDAEIGRLIKTRLETEFGVTVNSSDVSDIDIDTDSEGYRRLMSITRDLTGAAAAARTEAEVRNISDMQRIHSQDYEDTLRIRREEEQYGRHLETQEQHIGVHRINRQAEVGIAGAKSLGSRGQAGGGFDPAGAAAGMAVGAVIGRELAGAVSETLSPTQTPPPIPTAVYYVADSGARTGPFDLTALRQMVSAGLLTPGTLVWKAGMPQWAEAAADPDLAALFR